MSSSEWLETTSRFVSDLHECAHKYTIICAYYKQSRIYWLGVSCTLYNTTDWWQRFERNGALIVFVYVKVSCMFAIISAIMAFMGRQHFLWCCWLYDMIWWYLLNCCENIVNSSVYNVAGYSCNTLHLENET